MRKFLLFFVLTTTLGACTATILPTQPLSVELQKLNQVNNKRLRLLITRQENNSTVGYQYLMLLIPFGAVYISEPEQYLRYALYHNLGLAGYQLLPATSDIELPQLTLEISEIKLNAYDFIFTRYIVAKAKVQASYYNPKRARENSVQLECRSTSYRRFAFQSELNQVWQECLEELVEKGLEQIVW